MIKNKILLEQFEQELVKKTNPIIIRIWKSLRECIRRQYILR